jgi:predicted AlkP superfamily pyrophosphatase or phosphodiesterase
MVTGVTALKHSVLYNGLAVRADNAQVRVEPWVDKEVMVRVPTVYDLASQAGLTTAEVDWVAIQNPKTINWSFAERPKVDDKLVQEMIAEGIVSKEEVAGFASAPITWRDDVWVKACTYILRKHRPNLMLFHLLNTDSVQHRYGAGSLASNTALAYADTRVQMILDTLKENDLLKRSTILVVSDHGFKSYKRTIRANALLRQAGLLKQENGKITCDAYVVPEGGTAMLYITNPSRKAELTRSLAEMFGKVEGIERVISPADFAPLGYPDPKDNPRMADFVLAAKEGYSFSGDPQGEVVMDVPAGQIPGSHGYLNTDPDMKAIFVAWGRGITPGRQLETVRNIDIAPTIGALLGISMKEVDGKVLTDILIP